MSTDLIRAYMNILIFLYWEEKVSKDHIPISRIQNEIEIGDVDLTEVLKVLYDYDWISLERNRGIIKVRILDKGKIRAEQLLSV
jgi:hypothetical protein